ncbi:MAG TPA: succinyl-diaminopimelate desuccinylase [Geminicoccaceae bacterium]|nr:succinyl-diaminopimelate desuccinylase [Geminicoccus sp.]HMU49571.1 succinyl-diaminopimelate desuccinylase [Geminicoccaceae bacterium]
MSIDPVGLTQALIRCPSVTPDAGGALDVVARELGGLGFTCHRLRFEEPGTAPVDNLYARLGSSGPHLAFAGHVDVVPPGDPAAWTADPFAGEVRDGMVWGRGAADMKSGVAAFIAAVSAHLDDHGLDRGSISLLITGDEEGEAVNGTVKILAWMAERGERPDACLVGEPTSPQVLGDMAKIGRRGSANVVLVVHGRQGHTAYPHRADNAAHRLVAMLAGMTTEPLDDGSELFEPSTLQITTVDVGNPATNVVPPRAEARINIRYNDLHDPGSLERWLRRHCDAVGGRYELTLRSSGDAFFTAPGPLSESLSKSVEAVTGRRPELSTSGGTSDARFVRAYCPVIEFGLVGATMHQVDERVAVADIQALTRIYRDFIGRWLAAD